MPSLRAQGDMEKLGTKKILNPAKLKGPGFFEW